MTGLTWWQAERLARAGTPVRRAIWSDPIAWITYRDSFFWLHQEANGARETPADADTVPHIVLATEFRRNEFKARDWTDEYPVDFAPATTLGEATIPTASFATGVPFDAPLGGAMLRQNRPVPAPPGVLPGPVSALRGKIQPWYGANPPTPPAPDPFVEDADPNPMIFWTAGDNPVPRIFFVNVGPWTMLNPLTGRVMPGRTWSGWFEARLWGPNWIAPGYESDIPGLTIDTSIRFEPPWSINVTESLHLTTNFSEITYPGDGPTSGPPVSAQGRLYICRAEFFLTSDPVGPYPYGVMYQADPLATPNVLAWVTFRVRRGLFEEWTIQI